jgi:DNA-binding LacI/PurR family transcriptional regulator
MLQSTDIIATAAVRYLLEEIERTPQPRQELLFEAELIVRESTGPAPRTEGGAQP